MGFRLLQWMWPPQDAQELPPRLPPPPTPGVVVLVLRIRSIAPARGPIGIMPWRAIIWQRPVPYLTQQCLQVKWREYNAVPTINRGIRKPLPLVKPRFVHHCGISPSGSNF